MQESLWVLAIVLLLAGVGLAFLVPTIAILEAGTALMLQCASWGVPLELVYFGGLRIALGRHRPPGWYWRSFEHHHLLTRTQRALVLPFFYAGALSFVGIVLGILVVVVGMVSVLL